MHAGSKGGGTLLGSTAVALLLLLGSVVPPAGAEDAPPGDAASLATGAAVDDASVCFIIRTYWGHGDTWGDKSLRRLLLSLRNQTAGSWEALLMVMDNRPFPELRRIVKELNDPRIWVFAEWINYKYAPKEGGRWSAGYHNRLYNVTDNAIRACPERSKWVVVTNGDNMYDKGFMQAVVSAPPDADVVAVDFYSRYQRPTALPCERFEVGPGAPPCKENQMRFCQTDLAANAYRLPRLLAEDRRFGMVDPHGTEGANDGIMAQTLKNAGWKVHYVHGRCLLNHSPSPQQCALAGGVWDDTGMSDPTSFGGSCASLRAIVDKMKAQPDRFELLELNVTHDRNSFSYGSKPFWELKCLRLADPHLWTQAATFGRVCTASMDMPALPEGLPAHPWDAWVPPADEVAREAARVRAGMEAHGTMTEEGAQQGEEEGGEVQWHGVQPGAGLGGGAATEHTEL